MNPPERCYITESSASRRRKNDPYIAVAGGGGLGGGPHYSKGGIQIFLGDCRDILPGLPKVDLVLTDPPYGIFLKGGKWGKKFGKGLDWDRKTASNIMEIIKYGNNSIVWGGNYYRLPPSRGWLVWYKRDAVPRVSQVELAWT